nr:succinylglutamate desuccinylase/aspartoacylase family protein [uncultured Desulfobacter sp.]
MQRAITISDATVKSGTRATIHIPVPRLYTHTKMTMPVHVIHGRQPGPKLFVSSTVHGDEIIGIEIIRRLIALKKLDRLKGTLIAVPVVNVYAFIQNSRYSPDRRDLNRFFPGSDSGSLTSRLAATFMNEIVQHCDFGIDLHAGSNHRANLPQIRVNFDDEQAMDLARAFQVPAIINAKTRKGSLRQAARDKNVSTILYEAGEALRFDEVAIKAGVRGILSAMAVLDMLPKPVKKKKAIETLFVEDSYWVRAPASGILHIEKPLGNQIDKNTRVGFIADPFGGKEIEVVSAVSGMVIGCLNLPLVHQGDAIIHIASVEQLKLITPVINDFKEELG